MTALLTLNTGNDGSLDYDALVYDPFSGLGSTVLEAVRQGRRGYGSELNPASVADSLVYLRRHDAAETTPTLFDLLDLEGTAA